MLTFILNDYPYIYLFLVSFVLTFVLSMWQASTSKYSTSWYVLSMLPLPFIFGAQQYFNTHIIFLSIALVIYYFSHMLGYQFQEKSKSIKNIEKIERIPKIVIPYSQKIDPKEVMVILLNRGGPAKNTKVIDIRRNFLADPYAVKLGMPSVFQYFYAVAIGNYKIETFEKRYQLIGGGSLMYQATQNQMIALYQELLNRIGSMDLNLAFSYSSPTPREAIKKIKESQKKYIIPLSLYPHYSKATTGSILHKLKSAAHAIYPKLEFIDPPTYHMHIGFINAFVDRIMAQVHAGESLSDFHLLFVAPGLRKTLIEENDVFVNQIHETIAIIISKIKNHRQWNLAFLEGLGMSETLQPSITPMLDALARKGIKKIITVPISFVVEDVETSCEIDNEAAQYAKDIGITDFRMSHAIESHPEFIRALADTIISALN